MANTADPYASAGLRTGLESERCIRVMLDSNVFDALVAREPDRRAVIAAIRSGQLELVTTHLQEDEIFRVSARDTHKYWRMQSIPRTVVSTSDFILGLSRLGMARLGDGVTYNAVRTKQRHLVDAEIAATAQYERLRLVTDEKRLRNQSQRLGLNAYTSAELITAIRED